MSKNLEYFFFSFFLSSLFFLAINYSQALLEDFFFFQATKDLPLKAQISQEYFERFRPFRNWKIENLEIQAKSALSVLIDSKGEEKILFEKNSQEKLPIASLTKLMTALVSLENYDLSQIVEITERLPNVDNQPKIGEKFEVGDLLYFLLITSDNQIAENLAKIIGKENFVFLMNKKAKELLMENTYFINPSGLDSKELGKPDNLSTAKDLAILAKEVFKNPFLFKVLSTNEIEIYSRENQSSYKLKNTNELLGKSEILAGKTGWTPKARGCLIVLTSAPKNKGEVISIILGSENRFEEMEKLLNWIKSAYIF